MLEKEISCDFTYTWNLKKKIYIYIYTHTHTNKLIYKTERLTVLENLWLPEGKVKRRNRLGV